MKGAATVVFLKPCGGKNFFWAEFKELSVKHLVFTYFSFAKKSLVSKYYILNTENIKLVSQLIN